MPLLLPPISWDALWMSKSSVPAKLQAADCCSALFADLASEASVFEVFVLLIKNMYQGSTRDDIIKNTSRSLRLLQEFWIQKTFFVRANILTEYVLILKNKIQEFRRCVFTDFRPILKIRKYIGASRPATSRNTQYFTRKSAVMLIPRLRLNQISILINKHD